MIGRAEFAAMKPTAVLVNVGRGRLVDEGALVEALRTQRIGGAAIDAFVREPVPPDHPLWTLPNVLLDAAHRGIRQRLLEAGRRSVSGEFARGSRAGPAAEEHRRQAERLLRMAEPVSGIPPTLAQLPFFVSGRFPRPDLLGRCESTASSTPAGASSSNGSAILGWVCSRLAWRPGTGSCCSPKAARLAARRLCDSDRRRGDRAGVSHALARAGRLHRSRQRRHHRRGVHAGATRQVLRRADGAPGFAHHRDGAHCGRRACGCASRRAGHRVRDVCRAGRARQPCDPAGLGRRARVSGTRQAHSSR